MIVYTYFQHLNSCISLLISYCKSCKSRYIYIYISFFFFFFLREFAKTIFRESIILTYVPPRSLTFENSLRLTKAYCMIMVVCYSPFSILELRHASPLVLTGSCVSARA